MTWNPSKDKTSRGKSFASHVKVAETLPSSGCLVYQVDKDSAANHSTRMSTVTDQQCLPSVADVNLVIDMSGIYRP